MPLSLTAVATLPADSYHRFYLPVNLVIRPGDVRRCWSIAQTPFGPLTKLRVGVITLDDENLGRPYAEANYARWRLGNLFQ